MFICYWRRYEIIDLISLIIYRRRRNCHTFLFIFIIIYFSDITFHEEVKLLYMRDEATRVTPPLHQR